MRLLALRRPRPLVVEMDEARRIRKSRQDRVLSEAAVAGAAATDCGVSGLARQLDPATREALVERVRFYRDLGLTEFYRRPVDAALLEAACG